MVTNLRTGKSDQRVEVVVTDLDALVSEAVSFRFGGRLFKIMPITTEIFYSFIIRVQKVFEMSDKNELTAEDIHESYFEVFKIVCEDIRFEHVKAMSVNQLAALFQLCIDTVMGKSQTSDYDLKKKLQPLTNSKTA